MAANGCAAKSLFGVLSVSILIITIAIITTIQAQWAVDDDGCPTPDRGRGVCVPIHQCKHITDYLAMVSRPISQKIQERLRAYTCGYQGKSVKVCCPPTPLTREPVATPEPPKTDNHRNIDLVPRTCGLIDSSNRIVNGDSTGLFEFPWMALISFQSSSGLNFGCGGTIISERYILTAAHCISDKTLGPKGLTVAGVRVGDHNVQTPQDCETLRNVKICAAPFQDIRIEKLIPHEKFSETDLTNDIGLIRLASPIDLTRNNTSPVCLPLGSSRLLDFSSNNKGIVAGWGATETNLPSVVLLKATMQLSATTKCQSVYPNRRISDDSVFCAGGTTPKSSCTGDSGGPFMKIFIDDDIGDAVYVQQGIISAGPSNCGALGFPSIFTKVQGYMNWIVDQLEA